MNIDELKTKGIDLRLVDNVVRYTARVDKLTPEVIADMQTNHESLRDELRQLEQGDKVLDRWKRDSIPQWKRILAESIDEGDDSRRDYAIWMLQEVLGYESGR